MAVADQQDYEKIVAQLKTNFASDRLRYLARSSLSTIKLSTIEKVVSDLREECAK